MSGYIAFARGIVGASAASDFEDAIKEWHVYATDEDPECDGVCICGKTGLRELNLARNKNTGDEIVIGSRCVRNFGSDDMKAETKAARRKLTHAQCQLCKKETPRETGLDLTVLCAARAAEGFEYHEEGAFICKRCSRKAMCCADATLMARTGGPSRLARLERHVGLLDKFACGVCVRKWNGDIHPCDKNCGQLMMCSFVPLLGSAPRVERCSACRLHRS